MWRAAGTQQAGAAAEHVQVDKIKALLFLTLSLLHVGARLLKPAAMLTG
jgi:hypothetical protein